MAGPYRRHPERTEGRVRSIGSVTRPIGTPSPSPPSHPGDLVPTPDPHRLPSTVIPSRYELTLEPDLQASTFAGFASITVDISEPVTEVHLHASELTIDEAWLEADDGARLDVSVEFHAETEQATLTLDGSAQPGRWTVHLRFAGELNDKLTGFYRSTFTAPDGQVHLIATTQFEATYARKAFPCWDEPERKAVFAVTLVVPDGLLAISNAAEISSEPTADGRRAVRFADTIAMSTYLVAFVVGPLEATDPVDVDGTPLRVVYPPGRGDLTAFALEAGAFAVRHLADYYGIAYPGDKLDLVAIPDFSFGAMENLGCVTFRETLLLIDPERVTQAELQRVVDVVAHEIAHMWFGDLVTMKWWNGIWLNEAFATFMEMLVTDAFRPDWDRWTDFGLSRSTAFDTDSLSTTRPIEYEVISPADAEGMFDVLTYEKGAAVLRMLEQYLGAEDFRAGIGRYLRAHAYANTETTDLWDAIEDEVAEPIRRVMDSWIFQAGHPIVTVALTDGGRRAQLTQARFRFVADGRPADDADAPMWAIPVVLRVGREGQAETHKVLLDTDTLTVDLGEPADWVVGNHHGAGFYRTAYDDALLDRLALRAQLDLTPLERYGLVEDLWAAVLAGRTSVDRLLGLLRTFAEETDLSVWQRIVGILGGLERLVGDDERARYSGFVRSLVGPAAKRLGSEPTEGEPDRVASLRALLFEALCRFGDDDVEQARAVALYEQLGSDAGSVDPELANASVRIAAAGADAARFDDLLARSEAAATPQDKIRYLGALADVADPSLFDRFLAMILTDDVRTQDAALLLRRAMGNRANTSRAWAFITTNWDTLISRLPSAGIPRLVDGITVVNDAALADEIETFLDRHPVPQAAKKVAQYCERMRVGVALRSREAARLGDALA